MNAPARRSPCLDGARRRSTNGRRDDAGFTLIEVLIALVILGVGVVGLLYGLSASIRMGVVNRNQSRASVILANAAAAIGDANRNPYVGTCSPAPTYDPSSGSPALPAGYSMTTTVQYLYNPANIADPLSANWSWNTTCAQNKMQKVVVALSVPGGGNPWTIEVLRRPL